jgi:glycogen synthase
MQLCEEVADGLAARGHSIAVLTSNQIDGQEIKRPYPVYRSLQIEPDFFSSRSAAQQFFLGRKKREGQALSSLRSTLSEFEPEIVFVWHAIGLPKIILREMENLTRYKVVYYLADYQPELADEYMDYWKGQPVHGMARLLKRPVSRLALRMLEKEGKPIILKYENAICVSDFVRRRLIAQNLISPQAVVIHNGVDLNVFTPNGNATLNFSPRSLRCLVAGRIIPNKGIHTVIRAFSCPDVKERQGRLTLTIQGDGPQGYVEELKNLVEENDLQNLIDFLPPVPRSEMPEILSQHDIVILASEYDEPLARSSQEAMALGRLVIGTLTGGSGELLAHEKTGLVFEAGNPVSLAEQLARAVDEPELVRQLSRAGREEVEKNFNIERTIEKIEAYLQGL